MTIEQTLRRGREQAGREFHGVPIQRSAKELRDETLSLAASDASFANIYAQLGNYFETNIQALANIASAAGQQNNLFRVPSNVGFSQVMGVRSGVPFYFFVAPKDGGFAPRPRGFENPIQVCMHSFGLGWSQYRLSNHPSSLAPAADRFGYNPNRFLNGIRDMNIPLSEGGRVVGVHHFVSRRGDICNMVPWDYRAFHVSRFANIRSIAIELECHLIRDTGVPPARQLSFTNAVPPYTQEQILACAFLVKKMMAWTPDQRILRYLGVGPKARQSVGRQVPGMFTHHTVAKRSKVDAFCEWEFPPGYRKGDPYPDHPTFSTFPSSWDRRIERFHADKPRGAPLSHWDQLFFMVKRMRSFNLQTEVFDTALANSFVQIGQAQVGGAGPSAAAQAAARVRTVGVIRSQSMTSTSRSGLYQTAQANGQASARTWQDARARTEQVANQAGRVPIIAGGTSFDYVTGEWVNSTTANYPVVAARTGSGAPVETPTVTDDPPEVPGD